MCFYVHCLFKYYLFLVIDVEEKNKNLGGSSFFQWHSWNVYQQIVVCIYQLRPHALQLQS